MHPKCTPRAFRDLVGIRQQNKSEYVSTSRNAGYIGILLYPWVTRRWDRPDDFMSPYLRECSSLLFFLLLLLSGAEEKRVVESGRETLRRRLRDQPDPRSCSGRIHPIVMPGLGSMVCSRIAHACRRARSCGAHLAEDARAQCQPAHTRVRRKFRRRSTPRR